MWIDLDGVRGVLRHVCTEQMDDCYSSVPTAPDVALLGMTILRDAIMEAMDIDEWEEVEGTELEDYRQRVDRFCFSYCQWGQQLGPGEHPRCQGCPLSMLTVEVLARQVARAKETT